MPRPRSKTRDRRGAEDQPGRCGPSNGCSTPRQRNPSISVRLRPIAWASASRHQTKARGLKNTHVFFFQAEDGIRDESVTGVQTCALPISLFLQAEDGIRDESVTGVQTCVSYAVS